MDLLFTLVFALAAGVIVNALADKLPYEPRQKPLHYADGTARPWYAWSGLAAFVLGARRPPANPDAPPLSWRYPLTEAAVIALMLLTWNAVRDLSFMSPAQYALYLVYIALLVLITVIDVEHRLIQFVVMIPSIALALLDALLLPGPVTFAGALAGAAFGFTIFFILYLGGFLFTYVLGQMRGEQINTVAFGFGDVMLITFAGALLGVAYTILTIFIAVFLGALGAVLFLVSRPLLRSRYTLFTAIPYGPYIVIATLIMLLYGAQVWFSVFRYNI
jgi:leader peptidase (prepilin peptidase)/N-methyltransferase